MDAVRPRLPVAVHLLLGAAYVAYMATRGCGSDECLGTLFAVVGGLVWLLAVPLVVVAARGNWLRAFVPAVLWVPVAWAVALGLFAAFPSLGGA